jgi:hypothetical protein
MQEYRKKRAKLAIPNDQKERRILLELEFNVDESVGLIKNFILAPAGYPFPIVGEEWNHKPHALAGSPPLKIHHNTNPNSVKIKQKNPGSTRTNRNKDKCPARNSYPLNFYTWLEVQILRTK